MKFLLLYHGFSVIQVKTYLLIHNEYVTLRILKV